VSTGTTYTITIASEHGYPTVAKIAEHHLKLFDERHPDINIPMSYTLNEVRDYLQAIAEKKIFTRKAKYPGAPIVYASVCHRMDDDQFVHLLLDFFIDLFESDEDDTPEKWSKIMFQFEDENADNTRILLIRWVAKNTLNLEWKSADFTVNH
jgi:hypothetical protein